MSSKRKTIPLKRGVLKISDWAGYVPHCDAIWASTWAEVALKWVEVEAKLRPNCAILGPSLAEVGAKWVQVGPKLEPYVAAILDRNGAFARFCADMQNAQITTVPCTFRRPGRE